jgi:hypothetical protein
VTPGDGGSGASARPVGRFAEVYAAVAKSWKPQVIVLGEKNSVVSERGI